MSKANNKKNNKNQESKQDKEILPVEEKQAPKEAAKNEKLPAGAVKMKFKEDKFYNDFTKPMFSANTIYILEGQDWIARWLKRGGEIVEGDLDLPEQEVNPSSVVANDEQKDEANLENGEESKEK